MGKGVSWLAGWAGEKGDLFSLLLFRHEDQHPGRAFLGHVRKSSCSTTGGSILRRRLHGESEWSGNDR